MRVKLPGSGKRSKPKLLRPGGGGRRVMADEQSGPPNKRRRPPTTIDAKATEVTSDPAAKTEPIDPPAESVPAEAAEGAPSPPSDGSQPSRWDHMNWRLAAAWSAGVGVLLLVLLALWGAGGFQS